MANLLEIYVLLFTDTLVSNFAFNVSEEIAVYSMKVFDYNSYLVAFVASIAFLVASLINYGFGIVCYNILRPFCTEENNQRTKVEHEDQGRSGGANIAQGGNIKHPVYSNIGKMQNSKYLPIILMLSAAPFFGKFIMLFAGFCRIRPILAFSIGSISKSIYYLIFMIV